MAEPVPLPQDWSDKKAVLAWQRSQPPAVLVTLLSREALRALPLIDEAVRHDAQRNRANVALPTFRAAAGAWLAATGPSHETENIAAALSAAAAAAIDAGSTAADVSSFAGGAATAAYFAAATAAGSPRPFAPFGPAMFMAADAAYIHDGGDAPTLACRPLWPDTPPELAQRAWADLRTHLLAAHEGWEVWTEWYDARLRGDPVDLALETRRVIEPKRWADGPAAVNAEIAAIIEDHGRERHSTVLARVAALEAEIASLRGASHGQIGHNYPPESIDVESPDITPALAELKASTASPDEPKLAAAAVRRLGRALAAILKWSAAKADRFVDGCIDAGAVAAVGVVTLAGLPEWATGLLVRFGEVVEAVAAWLGSFGMAM